MATTLNSGAVCRPKPLSHDHRHQVHALQPRPFAGFFLQAMQIELAVAGVGDDGIGHAFDADHRGQRAGVDAGQADDAARLQPLVEMARGAVVRRVRYRRAQDHAARARRRRHVHGLDVLVVGADIADMGEGEGDELAGVGGIGEDLLIPGHRGVEADLADGMAFGPQAKTFQHRAIGKHEQRGRLVVRPGVVVLCCCHERFTYSSQAPPSKPKHTDSDALAGPSLERGT
jgi:hypothetical protein